MGEYGIIKTNINFEFDIDHFVNDNMSNVINNNNIPKDLKDVWIQLAVECNIDKLYESMY